MRYLRETLNFFAFLMLFSGLIGAFYLLRDARMGQPLDLGLAFVSSLGAAPYFALFATGRALGASFFSELFIGASRSAERGYSKERAWAKAGRGKDAALGLLLRDRILGDAKGLWAVLEMARWDPSLSSEAVQAATRLIGSRHSSQADRDHAGRVLQLAKVSVSKPRYSDEHWR